MKNRFFFIGLLLTSISGAWASDIVPAGKKNVPFRIAFTNIDSFPQFVFIAHESFGSDRSNTNLELITPSTKLITSGMYSTVRVYSIHRQQFEKLGLVFSLQEDSSLTALFPFDLSGQHPAYRKDSQLYNLALGFLKTNGFVEIPLDTIIKPAGLIPDWAQWRLVVQKLVLSRTNTSFTARHDCTEIEYENGAILARMPWEVLAPWKAPIPQEKKEILYSCTVVNATDFPGWHYYMVEFADDSTRTPIFRKLKQSFDRLPTAEIFATQDSLPEVEDYFKVRRSYASFAAGWDWTFLSNRNHTPNLVDSSNVILERNDRIWIRSLANEEYETEVTYIYADGREETRTYLDGKNHLHPLEIPNRQKPGISVAIKVICSMGFLLLIVGLWWLRFRKIKH
ncbi:hypothetical protein K1X84_09095 [bacterium]|nr:hypothetical protein [bacterium]